MHAGHCSKTRALSDKQAAALKRLNSAGRESGRGYTLKEAARGIFEHGLTPTDV